MWRVWASVCVWSCALLGICGHVARTQFLTPTFYWIRTLQIYILLCSPPLSPLCLSRLISSSYVSLSVVLRLFPLEKDFDCPGLLARHRCQCKLHSEDGHTLLLQRPSSSGGSSVPFLRSGWASICSASNTTCFQKLSPNSENILCLAFGDSHAGNSGPVPRGRGKTTGCHHEQVSQATVHPEDLASASLQISEWARCPTISSPGLQATLAEAEWTRDKISPLSLTDVTDL